MAFKILRCFKKKKDLFNMNVIKQDRNGFVKVHDVIKSPAVPEQDERGETDI